MASKVIFVFCLQLAIMKYTLAQCIPMATVPEPCGFTSGLTMNMPWIPSPSFSISSDDLGVCGTVTVCGSMPFLGTVSLAGEIPAAGQGTVMYNCGNGDVGIVSETIHSGMAAPMGICF
ncbi:chorion class B protein M2410-like [Bicyclus anynana]|uniref:Chorion class B protein M2410-like n=1 Tax=Bicyclus anynana TaxID=110368 RepID=A0A6J1N8R7_BICAN|nr:chorion class B protein M2410-like [Bicyclus anynana]